MTTRACQTLFPSISHLTMPLLPVAIMPARIPFPFRNALHADIHEYIMYLYAYVCIYTNGNTGTYACEHIHIYMVLLKQTEMHKNRETETQESSALYSANKQSATPKQTPALTQTNARTYTHLPHSMNGIKPESNQFDDPSRTNSVNLLIISQHLSLPSPTFAFPSCPLPHPPSPPAPPRLSTPREPVRQRG